MILLDGPYISEFLLETLSKNQFPVVATEYALEIGKGLHLNLVDEEAAIKRLERNDRERLYTPSENSIGWICRHLRNTRLPETISLFKNKSRFREMVRHLYPDLYFCTLDLDTLLHLPVSDIPLPCVVKPATGFFSLGVYPIFTKDDFLRMQGGLKSDLEKVHTLYPNEVFNPEFFIVEEYVYGDEFAIDAYYDASGEPVVLGMLQHLFSSTQDVRDRVYMTSADILRKNLTPVTKFLRQIGNLTGIANFPLHVEVRRRGEGDLVPIEINPMRFGGWCSTGDLAYHAWGTNVYEKFFLDIQPDWPALISNGGNSIFSLVVLENSTGISGADIRRFNYDAVLENFENPLKLTKADFRQYPLFGFLFVETRANNTGELERILHDDLRSYIELR
ncbi:MAG: ATP-grasp domain-containing protein [Acidobacteriota bacterium]